MGATYSTAADTEDGRVYRLKNHSATATKEYQTVNGNQVYKRGDSYWVSGNDGYQYEVNQGAKSTMSDNRPGDVARPTDYTDEDYNWKRVGTSRTKIYNSMDIQHDLSTGKDYVWDDDSEAFVEVNSDGVEVRNGSRLADIANGVKVKSEARIARERVATTAENNRQEALKAQATRDVSANEFNRENRRFESGERQLKLTDPKNDIDWGDIPVWGTPGGANSAPLNHPGWRYRATPYLVNMTAPTDIVNNARTPSQASKVQLPPTQ